VLPVDVDLHRSISEKGKCKRERVKFPYHIQLLLSFDLLLGSETFWRSPEVQESSEMLTPRFEQTGARGIYFPTQSRYASKTPPCRVHIALGMW